MTGKKDCVFLSFLSLSNFIDPCAPERSDVDCYRSKQADFFLKKKEYFNK